MQTDSVKPNTQVTKGKMSNETFVTLLMVAVLVFLGCAQTPHIYTMQPSELENIRSEISTIGVYLSPEP